MGVNAYGWLMLAGIAVSALVWVRIGRRDPRLPLLYVAALTGALVGAKLVYFLAEGWQDLGRPDTVQRLLTGKTILGGLLFGYVAVEAAKRLLRYPQPTGDLFALAVPLGLSFGRVGCWLQGCCLGAACPPSWYTLNDRAGVSRWPAVPVELTFNLLAFIVLATLRSRRLFPGQLFHLYLMAYGTFRFLHEFVRDTPRLGSGWSGYQWAALAVAALGALRFRQRTGAKPVIPSPPDS